MEHSLDRHPRISPETVREIAGFLAEEKGIDTVALDLRPQGGFTDYFIVTSGRSEAHQRGLIRRLHEHLKELGIDPRQSHRRGQDVGWSLLDCDDLVIHVMSPSMREFYDLEKLWFQSDVLYRQESEQS
ncbi:MAG: ribosome silencing factor [Alkalispirochaetaceae bacterium]